MGEGRSDLSEQVLGRRVREAELLNAIVTAAVGEDDLGRILAIALDHLTNVIPFTGATIALLEGDELVVRAAAGPHASVTLGQRLLRGGPIWDVLERGEPALHADLTAVEVLGFDQLAASAIRSFLAVPLAWRGEPFGVLALDSNEPDAFSADDLRLLQAAGRALSGSIELARRYTLEQVARREAEVVQDRLLALFRQAPAIIGTTRGPEHSVEFANPRARTLFGHRELVGRAVRTALPELAAQGFGQLFDRVYTTGEPYYRDEVSARIDRTGGGELEEAIFNLVIQPTRDASGAIDGTLVYAVDVTEPVHARRRAERLAGEQAAILGQVADAVVIADAEGRVTFANEAARRMHGGARLGVGVEEYSEAYHLFTLDGEPYPPAELPLARAVRHRETLAGARWRICRPNGREIIAQGTATPVLADDGSLLGAVLTIRDVTAEYEFAAQRDEFLSSVAHDLKNPLSTIKGLAQLLRNRALRLPGDDATWIAERLTRIDTAASRTMALINELVDVARLEMDQPLTLHRQWIDLVALVRRIADEHAHLSERHHISVEPEEPTLHGRWDGFRLERVIANLLSNAVKYTPEGGTISVRIGREPGPDGTGEEACVSVHDQGVGIPAADLPRVFERFHRGGNVAGRFAGTGVGLHGACQIVEQHGGTISVESQEGEGSTFTIHLPLNTLSAVRSSEP